MNETWCDWTEQAMRDLGGRASYEKLYVRIKITRPEPFSKEWKATVRQTLQTYSSDSDIYQSGNPDVFCTIGGKGSGRWGLRSFGAKSNEFLNDIL